MRVLGDELRIARQTAGLSLTEVGRAAGISGVHLTRLERGEVPGASVTLYARLFAVLGMRLSARPYPAGPPIRDAAHAKLLGRLRALLGANIRMRTEVPLRRPGDLRAWDAELSDTVDIVKVEAETVIHDLQATDRRLALKMADDDADRVILVVAATRRNRWVLREFGELVRARYPLAPRTVLGALRAGRLPEQSGIVAL